MVHTVSLLKKVSDENLRNIWFAIGEITALKSSNKLCLAEYIAASVAEIKAKYFKRESGANEKLKTPKVQRDVDKQSSMTVKIGWKSGGKKHNKRKQMKKIGGGIHEIKMKKTETLYENIIAMAKAEFEVDSNTKASLEVNGVDMNDFLDNAGNRITFAQFLKHNELYASRCKVYLVTDCLTDYGMCTKAVTDCVTDSGISTNAEIVNIEPGTSSDMQDIPNIPNPICISYRKIENGSSVSLIGKVSVIEKESCVNPGIMDLPSHDVNPIQYNYSIGKIMKNFNTYLDWKSSEDGESIEYIFPSAKHSDALILHGPETINGYDLCDFVLGVVVKCWADKPIIEWVCDGVSVGSGEGLYVINIVKPGLYFAKVTHKSEHYTSKGVCVFESFGYFQVGHVINDIPSCLDAEKTTSEQETNVEPLNISSMNCAGVPSITSSEFHLGSEIGKGNFGTVYKGSWLGTDVAIKKLPIPKKGKIAQTDVVKKEIEMLSRLRHPNLVQIMAYCLQASKAMILFEFMEGCVDLDEIIFPSGEANTQIKVDGEQKVHITLEIAQGLAYLHGLKPPVIHQDVKPANILVSKSLMVKICDLGVSRLRTMQTKHSGSTVKCVEGTPLYMAPECLLKKSRSTTASDMWSFSCTALELFTEHDIWDFEDQQQTDSDQSSDEPKDMIMLTEVLEKEEQPHALQYVNSMCVPQVVLDLILAGLAYQKNNRPTAVEVVERLMHYQTKCTRCSKKDQQV